MSIFIVIISAVFEALKSFWDFWIRRERIKIRFEEPTYKVTVRDSGVQRIIRLYWECEFRRLGGEDVRNIKQIQLKPAKEPYGKLKQYFKLPEDGVIKINKSLELPRGKKVTSAFGGTPVYPEFGVLPATPRDTGTRDEAQVIANELSGKTHKVGLVWDDNEKITWKTVRQEDYGNWV